MRQLKAPHGLDTCSIFLAGGITGCPDWQHEVCSYLSWIDKLTVYNPRRKEFDVNDPAMSDQQIEWEYRMMNRSDCIVFWFPEETLCPIVLFELGNALNSDKDLIIGVHENYAREFDVVKQVSLRRPEQLVVVGLDVFKQTIWGYLSNKIDLSV